MAQILSQSQQQRLSPQQYLVASMIESSFDDLEKRINEELEKNVALEEDHGEMKLSPEETSDPEATDRQEALDEDYADAETEAEPELRTTDDPEIVMLPDDDVLPNDPYVNRSPDDDDAKTPLSATDTTFREDLKRQLALQDLTDEDRYLCDYLVDSLEDDGYLRQPMQTLVDDLEFNFHRDTTAEHLEDLLENEIQTLEPTGIGARDLRECLLLQVRELKAKPATTLAERMLDTQFKAFSQRHFEAICEALDVTTGQLQDAIRVIGTLNPKPGGITSSTDVAEAKQRQVTPDFTVRDEDGQLTVALNEGHVPNVRISADYQVMLKRMQAEPGKSSDRQQGQTMIREGISQARQFIQALRQRRQTLLAVMKVLVTMQKDFFLTGEKEQLHPLTLKDVAERSGYDISTISRVARSKYVETDYGIYALKDLFSSAAGSDSDQSQAAVNSALQALIDNEDKRNPLSDDALAQALQAQGFNVARRTVAKYRDLLGINKAALRRQL